MKKDNKWPMIAKMIVSTYEENVLRRLLRRIKEKEQREK
jgi:hypothetical protein